MKLPARSWWRCVPSLHLNKYVTEVARPAQSLLVIASRRCETSGAETAPTTKVVLPLLTDQSVAKSRPVEDRISLSCTVTPLPSAANPDTAGATRSRTSVAVDHCVPSASTDTLPEGSTAWR